MDIVLDIIIFNSNGLFDDGGYDRVVILVDS